MEEALTVSRLEGGMPMTLPRPERVDWEALLEEFQENISGREFKPWGFRVLVRPEEFDNFRKTQAGLWYSQGKTNRPTIRIGRVLAVGPGGMCKRGGRALPDPELKPGVRVIYGFYLGDRVKFHSTGEEYHVLAMGTNKVQEQIFAIIMDDDLIVEGN